MRGKGNRSAAAVCAKGITPAYAGKSIAVGIKSSWDMDHPRLCGEKQWHTVSSPRCTGSPPPMRGKDKRAGIQFGAGGITPAYAGKRLRHRFCNPRKRDHPRLCGEKTAKSIKGGTAEGSPPPMRGKVLEGADEQKGKKDHPRLCGEKARTGSDNDLAQGSPPPMRGKALVWLPMRSVTGITPAYAGKSRLRAPGHCRNKDHPRLCGEKFLSALALDLPKGSPPPMRGKAISPMWGRLPERITPAYAGKSRFLVGFLCRIGDHPRLCGEKQKRLAQFPPDYGSPPPMRGKVTTASGDRKIPRITPAYAGKSSAAVRSCWWSWDHPRLCGEKTKKIPKQRYFFHQPASFSFSLQYT